MYAPLRLLELMRLLRLLMQAHPAPAAASDGGVGRSCKGPPGRSTPAHASAQVVRTRRRTRLGELEELKARRFESRRDVVREGTGSGVSIGGDRVAFPPPHAAVAEREER